MKLLLDFLPLLLFFGVYMLAGRNVEWATGIANQYFSGFVSGGVIRAEEAPALLATIAVIGGTLIQLAALKLMRRKIDMMLWITLALVVVLGGATVWFHNPTFIKWKPSGYFWAMAVGLWLSRVVFKKNLLRTLMGGEIELPDFVWQRLNIIWVAFFSFMGFLNIYVAYSYPESTWVTFKVFGITVCMFVFMAAQVIFISRYLKDEPKPAEPAPADKTP
ncbi:septation protein A [Piscinibacter sp. HJYY11]|uniref:septation protein A n=1 Tax=Piscinibacter sp. HJYY11 TaxID=2801333 RepID=UPI00191FC5D6|nr:septation protein A [Piscinibacter sp. HJYY11]MBL0726868.1 septation protein A [Piscinibacter sp. HJYY11]